MLALHAAWTMQPHCKERITPAMLLGEEIDAARMSPDQFAERMRRLREEQGLGEEEDGDEEL